MEKPKTPEAIERLERLAAGRAGGSMYDNLILRQDAREILAYVAELKGMVVARDARIAEKDAVSKWGAFLTWTTLLVVLAIFAMLILGVPLLMRTGI